MEDLLQKRKERRIAPLSILLWLCLCYFLIAKVYLAVRNDYLNWYFSYEQWPMVTLIVLAAVFYGILLYRQLLKEKDFTAGLAVFFIALLPDLPWASGWNTSRPLILAIIINWVLLFTRVIFRELPILPRDTEFHPLQAFRF